MRSRGDSVAAIGQIQAILFDMAGTLCKPLVKNNDRQAEIEQIIRLAEVEEKLDSRFRAYRKWSRSNSRELTEEDFWTQWMLPEQSPAKIKPLALELTRIWWEGLGERPVRQDLVPVIRELHRRGYRLGIVSNTISSRHTPDLMKKLGIHGLFDTIVLLAGTGRRKPHPSIFMEAVRNMPWRLLVAPTLGTIHPGM